MINLRYDTNLGEPDNAIRAGVRLEKMHAELYRMIQELPSVVSDALQAKRRLSESPTIGRFRGIAQQYINRARELSEQYPASGITKEYSDDITRRTNIIL